MLRLCLVLTVLESLACVSSAAEASWLKSSWKDIVKESGAGAWGFGHLHERRGQICDPWRKFGDPKLPLDIGQGCAVAFIADPADPYTVANLPLDQQDNFQNTQNYKAAWNLHGDGFLGNSLPRAPQDIVPVCYIVNVSGTVAIGYEEGNGGELLPCPGHRGAVPFTEEAILSATEEEFEAMCNKCYHSVCTGSGRKNPRDCGYHSIGAVDVGESDRRGYEPAELLQQATPAYHCHLTMADNGACDYVQFDQHEDSREYNMEYAVLCGWEKVRYLNITYCDCTAEAGTPNNCGREHCLAMAYEGVACGNCGNCNPDTVYEYIFNPPNEDDVYDGSCGLVRGGESEEQRNQSMMLCSKGLNCKNYNGGSGCKFHCDMFGSDSETWVDGDCPRKLPASCSDGVKDEDEEDVDCGGICGSSCTAPLGKDYRGCHATTVSGLSCQPWASQSPHSHSRTSDNYPDEHLVRNYCRNPDNEPEGPWCYTTDPEVRWEYCAVTCDL